MVPDPGSRDPGFPPFPSVLGVLLHFRVPCLSFHLFICSSVHLFICFGFPLASGRENVSSLSMSMSSQLRLCPEKSKEKEETPLACPSKGVIL